MVVNLLSVISLAILFVATPTNALSVDSSVHIARHHQVFARNIQPPVSLAKRSSRCKPRPTTSVVSSVHTSSTPPPAQPHTSASSPAPSPSPAPPANQGSTAGGKAGVAWALGADSALSRIAGGRVSYLYTWSPNKPPNLYGLKFLAQLWGKDQHYIDSFKSLVVPGYADAVLGFNEPNLSTQSGITPWDAAGLWKELFEPLKAHGYTLISPAPTSAPDGKTWLQQFFTSCNGCHIDAVALHWYGTNAQEFIKYVNDFHTTFGRDIYVTEFACMDFAGGPQADQGQIFEFMNTVTSFMDNAPYVRAYFAFGFMHDMGNVSPLNRLMNDDGTPNALGWDYIK